MLRAEKSGALGFFVPSTGLALAKQLAERQRERWSERVSEWTTRVQNRAAALLAERFPTTARQGIFCKPLFLLC